jgi:hypothetical protein
MKKIISGLLTCFLACVVLTSFSTGEAEAPYMLNLTGAGGSTNNCAGSGCHDANSSNLNLSIILTDLMTGDTIKNGKYFPDGIYGVKLYGFVNSVTTIYPKFAFQFSSMRANGSFGGDYQPTPGLKANPAGGFEIVEPMQPLDSLKKNHFAKTIYWKAPGPGAGNVTLHATMLAANDNGFASGDVANNENRVFTPVSAGVGELTGSVKMQVFPNPSGDLLNLEMSQLTRGMYQFVIYNRLGQVLENKSQYIGVENFKTQFRISSFPPGNYFLQVSREGEKRILPFVKMN